MLQALLGGAKILGGLLGGGGGGAAKERQAQNDFLQSENNRAAQMYGTQQNALQININLG